MSRSKQALQLHMTDRVVIFGHIVCRVDRPYQDGYTLRVLEEPHALIFVSHEELHDLAIRAELRIEPRYFAATPAQNVSRRKQPPALIATRKNHPGNGTVH